MYDYFDYFDENQKKTPYESYTEEIDDYLRLLDMMLEGYLEYKGLAKEKKLFSRGLVITESEMTSYFEMPPYFREGDLWDPVLAGASGAAFDYIDARIEQSKCFLPLEFLKEKLSLDRTGLLALLLVIAPQIDRKYERIYGFLQDDIKEKQPTVGLLFALMRRITVREESGLYFPEPVNEESFAHTFLRGSKSIELYMRLSIDPLIKGIILSKDEDTVRCASQSDFTSMNVPFFAYEEEDIPLFFDEYKDDFENVYGMSGQTLCYIENEDKATVLHILHKMCEEKGEKLYILDFNRYLAQIEEKGKEILSALYLRMTLFNGRLCILYEKKDENERVHQLLNAFSGICKDKCILITGEAKEPGELAAYQVPALSILPPDVELRILIWEHFLKETDGVKLSDDVNIPDIADCYEIPYGMIKNVSSHVLESAKLQKNQEIDSEMISDSIRQLNQVNFSKLATYIKAVYKWEDLTIVPYEKTVLKTACDRYRLRNRVGDKWGLKKKNAYGNGVSILLYGPPGTGKTMAAQIVARELSLPLYRVDVSQIFSKYVGETEKNLSVIFDAAEKSNVILFFDEADALFAKRTEVSQSNDKYSNSETSYLLQKIEEYDGMSILATNYYNNFDSAFVRRITYSVHMDRPDEDARYELWTNILPAETEIREDIDFRFLAKQFELSGSNIKAILYSAAYMAGAEEKPIGPEHIVRAMQYEFQKTGRLINRGDFGIYGMYLS